MPIVVPKDMPAAKVLQDENIFVINEKRATSQDIRPLEIAIVNLMPTKIVTETQLMRLLSNSPLQINVTLIATSSYVGKNTPLEHLEKFYKTFDEIKDEKFDGLIVTGAPVEDLDFSQVRYWEELERIFEYAKHNVTSTIFICWGAQAALYYYYGIEKHALPKKLFGVFGQEKYVEYDKLLKGTDDILFIPHSRHSALDEDQLKKCSKLVTLAGSEKTGSSIIRSKNGKFIFITGHMEYDRFTLDTEYKRDIAKGLKIDEPENYYTDASKNTVDMKWSSAANILYMNWLNTVYQETPYDINAIK